MKFRFTKVYGGRVKDDWGQGVYGVVVWVQEVYLIWDFGVHMVEELRGHMLQDLRGLRIQKAPFPSH